MTSSGVYIRLLAAGAIKYTFPSLYKFLGLLIQQLPQVFMLCKGQMKKRQEERKEFRKINHQALQMKNATQ